MWLELKKCFTKFIMNRQNKWSTSIPSSYKLERKTFEKFWPNFFILWDAKMKTRNSAFEKWFSLRIFQAYLRKCLNWQQNKVNYSFHSLNFPQKIAFYANTRYKLCNLIWIPIVGLFRSLSRGYFQYTFLFKSISFAFISL